MKYLNRWLQFTKERFSPVSYSVMIIVFLGAHYGLYLNFHKERSTFNIEAFLHLVPLALAVFLFFFKIRLFDEVKDIESDLIYHPERPLPRGILNKSDIHRMAFLIIILEFLFLSFYGIWASLSLAVAVMYSLIMYKEFFLKKWLRLHLTTYAITHTFIVVFISITIFISLFNKNITQIPANLIYFSFAGWFLFNIFEFGRKTFASREEKRGVASYSKVFGKFGAIMLALVMAVSSILFIDRAIISFNSMLLFLWLTLTGTMGLSYVIFDRPSIARAYRAITSLYIVLTYGTVMILQLYAIR